MIDPYSILGISRDASDEEVKKAYRKMSTKYTSGMFQHEVYFFRSYHFGSDDQVYFVLSVFFVYYNDKLTLAKVI